jgi:hypothetical protein
VYNEKRKQQFFAEQYYNIDDYILSIFNSISTFETRFNKDFCDWNLEELSAWYSTKNSVRMTYLNNVCTPLKAYVQWCDAHQLRMLSIQHPIETSDLGMLINASKFALSTFYGFEELDEYMSYADKLPEPQRYYPCQAICVLSWFGLSLEMMRYLRLDDIQPETQTVYVKNIPDLVGICENDLIHTSEREMYYLNRYQEEAVSRNKDLPSHWFLRPAYATKRATSDIQEQCSPVQPAYIMERWRQMTAAQPLTSPLRAKKIYRTRLCENNFMMMVYRDQQAKNITEDDASYWKTLKGEVPKREWGLLLYNFDCDARATRSRMRKEYALYRNYFQERG